MRTRLVSFVVSAALVLCAILSIGFPTVRADEDVTDRSDARTEPGVRFVQVAAGEDFAIGLTYDRKLYGWSLKESRDNPAQTLGDYYTENPTEIKFNFRVGPGNSGILRWNNTDETSGSYHAVKTDDRIKKIVATRTTAAFLTEKGYIYTWGKDDTPDATMTESTGNTSHYLLLRNFANSEAIKSSWETPYIIDYDYYSQNNYLQSIIPTGNTEKPASDIAAGEYNYIFMHAASYGGSKAETGTFYSTFVWGSLLYSAPNVVPPSGSAYYEYTTTGRLQGGAQARRIYKTAYASTVSNVSVVAGGYTVGVNGTATAQGSTSLQIRGKNFLTTGAVTAASSTPEGFTAAYDIVNTVSVITPAASNLEADGSLSNSAAPGSAVSNIRYSVTNTDTSTYAVNGALAGANGSASNEDPYIGFDLERYYARQRATQTTTAAMTYSVNAPAPLVGAQKPGTDSPNTLTTYGDNLTALTPANYAVSLGNDIGYGISAGKLYAWGDNKYGQLADANITDNGGQYSQTPVGILTDKTFRTVAAGKQLTNGKAFYDTTFDTTSGVAFATGVQNDSAFISGAVTTSGELWVWSTNKQTPVRLLYGNVADADAANKSETFAAVYSAYGNRLFAVTSRGKLVLITRDGENYAMRIYDKFYDANGTEIVNWTVNQRNNINDAVFTVPQTPEGSAPVYAPGLGSATFYVWSATTVSGAVGEGAENTVIINGTRGGAAYKPLVESNRIGDAYRIVGAKASDASIDFVTGADGLDNTFDETDADNKYYAPVFKFGNDESGYAVMTDEQRDNMFGFEFTYDAADEHGLGMTVTPKQSSKGKKILVEFYIARFNSYEKFTGKDQAQDNAIYYDFLKCQLRFEIQDTPTVMHFSAFDDTNDGKSSIPVLDPNNEYNTNYSVAVQNVSTGVDALIQFLRGTPAGSADTDSFKQAVLEELREKDIGFPDSRKIEAGNLDYYLGSDVAMYNDIYRYIYDDRDSDIVLVSLPSSGRIITASGASGAIVKVDAEVALGSGYLRQPIADLTAAKINKKLSTDFNNTFGLFNIAVSEDKATLSFSYYVVTFTGTGATGVLDYTSNEEAKTASVTDYIVDESGSGAFASIVANTVVVYGYDADKGYVADTNRDNYKDVDGADFAMVFSEPTLRFRTDLEGKDQESKIDINGEYGGGKNIYVDKKYDTELFVGETRRIELSSFFNRLGDRISFAYNNSADATALAAFSRQFSDDTMHPNTAVVTLSNTSLTIKPTTTAPIDLTVDIMRFADNNRTVRFADGENFDEKISVTFRFTNIVGFVLNRTDAPTQYLVTKDSVLDLFGDTVADNLINASRPYINITSTLGGAVSPDALTFLKSNAKIYGLKTSSGNDVFDCNYTDNSQRAIFIKPKKSGSGLIQFNANIFGESQAFSITVNVRKETTLPFDQRVTIVDDKYVSVRDITTKLVEANSFNGAIDGDMSDYKILVDDIENPEAKKVDRIYNAISFTNSNGDPGMPAFIKNVIFEGDGDNADIRLISNNTSTQNSETYYMHVKYTNADVTKYADAPAGSVIEMLIPVVSGKVKLQHPTLGGDLTASIDCRHPQNSANWWTTEGSGLDTRVTIDLSYLLEIDEAEGADRYKIFLVSSESAASSYFNYSIGSGDRSIIITPIDNTPLNDKVRQTFELNVSVYKEGEANSTKVYAVDVSIAGIVTTLPVTTEDGVIGYGNIWLYSFIIVFGVLAIIFVIRIIVYLKKRAKQRAIIKRNQELIRMRDRMHNKATAATREQIVKTKLKMEDPKYAKIFNEMRKNKEEESGVILENSDLAATASKKVKKKKKKGGKKTVAELKAELEAKKAAFAAAQSQNAQPVNPFVSEVPIEGAEFENVAPDFGGDAGGFGGDAGFAPDGGFADGGGFATPDMDGGDIIFDASDVSDGM